MLCLQYAHNTLIATQSETGGSGRAHLFCFSAPLLPHDDLLDIRPTESGKTPFADVRNKNPSYPLILAQNISETFRSNLAEAWSKDSLTEEEIFRLGKEVIETGAAEQTRSTIEEKINLAIEALGAYVERPGCREIALWVRNICKSLPQSEAV